LTSPYIVDQGRKPVVHGPRMAASTGNPIVTETVMAILAEGGNAADAAIAGALVQAAVEPHLTSHAGMVSCLYWDEKSGTTHQLNALGTLAPDLAPFRPVNGVGGWAREHAPGPQAAIPGFMPGLGTLHEKFGSLPWARLVEPAIRWAEEGHPVSSFEYGVNVFAAPFFTYFAEGREVFMPEGHLVPVGQMQRNPRLAATLRTLASDGPAHFTTGGWARDFVRAGNDLGWPVRLEHMTANPPRWQTPLGFSHCGHDIVSLGPPERQAVFCAIILGVLDELGVAGMEPMGADYVYYMGHLLRLAEQAVGFLHDSVAFGDATVALMDPAYHKSLANILRSSRPRADLTEHVRLGSGAPAFAATGWPAAKSSLSKAPLGSCEISIADAHGNVIQMMNTIQSGGIPGFAVGGVAMMGSHEQSSMAAHFQTWRVPGVRMRNIIGNTFVMRDGKPWLGLGTPGNVYATVVQMLVNILDFGMTPDAASDVPRMLPLTDDYILAVEGRLSPQTVVDLTARGIRLAPTPSWDWNMGSFQMVWRDPAGGWNAHADFRRTGAASAR
jgi:gamma-glutamyltranspeptidase/glutathione hydrolase